MLAPSPVLSSCIRKQQIPQECQLLCTGTLASPLSDLLPDVFFMVRIFRLMLVLLYINSNNIPPIKFINRIYETQNRLSLQLVPFLVGLRTYQHPCTRVYGVTFRIAYYYLTSHIFYKDEHNFRLKWYRARIQYLFLSFCKNVYYILQLHQYLQILYCIFFF